VDVLRRCRKLVVFDAMPGQGEKEAAAEQGTLASIGQHWVPSANTALAARYEAYKRDVEALLAQGDPLLEGVELLPMQRWGHLVGTVRHALERVSTPFVLLHQHDLLINGENFSSRSVVGILRALARGDANYVLLNRDVNCAGRSTQYFQAAPHSPHLWRSFVRRHALRVDLSDGEGGFCGGGHFGEAVQLTPFVGYSDQTHFARSEWVRERVLPLVGSRRCCMEFALHEIMILGWLHDPACWERTYMLGGMDDGAFIFDLQKNGTCWAPAADAYSAEKEEEMYVPPSDRITHPTRPGLTLALYVDSAVFAAGGGRLASSGNGRRRPDVVCFPDSEASRNRVSRETFLLPPLFSL